MKAEQQILLAHSGKQHAYQVAKAMNELGYLKKFYTSSYISNTQVQAFLLKRNDQFWTRRFLSGLGGNKVEANWRFEIPEMLARLTKKDSAKIESLVYQRDQQFDSYMASRIRKLDHPFFWGFQGSCLESIKATNKQNGFSVCELATAHVTYAKKILGEEKQLLPEWSDSISNVVFPAAYEKRLEEEPIEAKLVIAASGFTKFTLTDAGIPSDKISILPLGAPVDHIRYDPNKSTPENRPLKLLYAGTVTQRKGIAYLLEAMKRFSNREVELHIIGSVFGQGTAFNKYKDLYNYHGPCSQVELFDRYSDYDALVLPTIFEGFALVVVEAMAAGLPVITTPHSIGADLISDDRNGYLVPIRQVKAIENAILKLREKNTSEWQLMRISARETALNYSWSNYKNRLANFLIHL